MPITWPTLALAFAGTLVVYNIDRLRDLELDRNTAPLRNRLRYPKTGALCSLW